MGYHEGYEAGYRAGHIAALREVREMVSVHSIGSSGPMVTLKVQQILDCIDAMITEEKGR